MNSIFLSISSPIIKTQIHSLNSNELKFYRNPFFLCVPLQKSITLVQFSPQCSASTSKPPTSREEAILQAKVSLSSTLDKPLNNPKLAAGKLKKVKQPRFRVEVPIINDSVSSLTQLAIEVFGDLPTKRKNPKIKIVFLWPDQSFAQAATKAFEEISSVSVIESVDICTVLDQDSRTLSSADALVFMAPEVTELETIKKVVESLYPKPVVMFNPKWTFEEESNFDEMRSFLGSFDVVYSFMGLEVRGLLSKRKGVIFKCVKDGVLSGEKWNVLVEEGEELKVVSRFSTRPSIAEVENVLYNYMAVNSPITKSAKFLKDLVSNVTGKK
ncbi:hypothetical protein LIER_14159 [Lithospermum erythrorhizon]|uniref:DUF1995 domain-containing protein n=1 Tax=Lithospermum erythrorhizon TaxID=34254 RepID=A0AAV3PZN5_LITER